MSKILIALDAGHGSDTYKRTGGKRVPGLEEHSFNAAVVKYAKELAEANGFEVLLTQPLNAPEVSLAARTQLANSKGAKILLSFHADANVNKEVRGHWVFYWHNSSNGKKLAEAWDKAANELLGNPCRGVMKSEPGSWTDFHMVRETSMVAILMEHAFMTNAEDLRLLQSEDFRRKAAEAAVRAICSYFGVTFKKPEPPKPVAPALDLSKVPTWAREAAKNGVASGAFSNPEGSEDFYRMIVILNNLGLFKGGVK